MSLSKQLEITICDIKISLFAFLRFFILNLALTPVFP